MQLAGVFRKRRFREQCQENRPATALRAFVLWFWAVEACGALGQSPDPKSAGRERT